MCSTTGFELPRSAGARVAACSRWTVRYEDDFLPSGSPTGTAEEVFDYACGLHLNDLTRAAVGSEDSASSVSGVLLVPDGFPAGLGAPVLGLGRP